MLIGLFGGIFDKFDDIEGFDAILVGLAISRCACERTVQERVLGEMRIRCILDDLLVYIHYYYSATLTPRIIAYLFGISNLTPHPPLLTPVLPENA